MSVAEISMHAKIHQHSHLSFPCSESSDWEAKFYQIQSKYLLLLNELHNPQVSESDSRKEMVGQLLKDVVEAADRPQLNDKNNAQFDRCVCMGTYRTPLIRPKVPTNIIDKSCLNVDYDQICFRALTSQQLPYPSKQFAIKLKLSS